MKSCDQALVISTGVASRLSIIIGSIHSVNRPSPQVLGSATEFHFVHRGLSHARAKRNIAHTRSIKSHPMVSREPVSASSLTQGGTGTGASCGPDDGIQAREERLYRTASRSSQHRLLSSRPNGPLLPVPVVLGECWIDLFCETGCTRGRLYSSRPLQSLHHSISVDQQKNVGQNGGKEKLDLNVEAAWAQGYTGKNVTTAIMDDGNCSPVCLRLSAHIRSVSPYIHARFPRR